jgi:predicted DCC family thiol-disulfide oxidoreductase YuxK
LSVQGLLLRFIEDGTSGALEARGDMRGDGLILFDGVCVLCSRGCRFVSRRDRDKYFRYVPMQSPEGRTIAASRKVKKFI